MKTHRWHPLFALLLTLTTIAPGWLASRKIRPAFAETLFEDIANHWAKDCIEDLMEKQIIYGYLQDRTFRPNAAVSRAEFAATIARAFPNAQLIREPMNFVDVPTDYWAKNAIQKAYQTGFVSGYVAKTFNPTLEVTRAQALMSLARGLKYSPQEETVANLAMIFEDAPAIPEAAERAIAAAIEKGIVVNYPNIRILNPNRNATRADVATFLCQALANSSNNNGQIVSQVPSEYIAKIPGTSPPNFTNAKKVVSGNLQVEVIYEKDRESEIGKNFRLKIIRNGKIVLEEPLLQPVISALTNSNLDFMASPEGRLLNLQLQDLDGDGELEVLVDLVSTNSSISNGSYSFIYHWQAGTENQYQKRQHFWGNFGYKLVDLDGDSLPEFKSFDGRFANAFASANPSVLPLQIWRYRQGKMEEVTKNFPAEIKTHSSQLWLEFNQGLNQNREVKGILAAYLANKYLVGEEEAAWNLLKKVYQGSDRDSYFAQIRQFFIATGYAEAEDFTPEDFTPAENQANPPVATPENPLPELPETNGNENRQIPSYSPPETNQTENIEPPNVGTPETASNTESTENSENTEIPEIPPIVLTENPETTAINESESTNPETPPVFFTENPETTATNGSESTVVTESEAETTVNEPESTLPVETTEYREGTATNEGRETEETATDDRPTVAIAPRLVRSLSSSGSNPVLSLAISLDGEILASSSGKEIKLWDLETGELLRTMSGHGGDVRSLAISPDGKAIASGSGDGTIRFWDTRTGEVLDTIWDLGWVTAVGFSDDGDKLVGAAYNRSLQVWDAWTAERLYVLNGSDPIAFARDGDLMATSGGSGVIRLWDVPRGQLLRNINVPRSEGGVSAIALREDGEVLANAIADNSRIFVWNLPAGEIRHTLDGHEEEIQAIAIGRDGKLIASSAEDGIKLWNLETGMLVKTIEGKGAIAFSADSKFLIGVGEDNQIQVWQIYAATLEE